MTNAKPQLKLGDRVSPYGRVVAIMLLNGERYYFFVGKGESVAMMPACAITVPPDKEKP